MSTTNTDFFLRESDFEFALVSQLQDCGWGAEQVLVQPDEQTLIQNWAQIIYDNNRDASRLGSYPLTDSEMQQVLSKVSACTSPYDVCNLIAGQSVCIKRDNPADARNYGKEVYLKIFNPDEIKAGQSRYQIVRQPRFKTSSPMLGTRRGDVMLLINGMPLIHIELKRSKVDVSQACYQIKRYAHEGVFSRGIFSMVQIFVAMTPEKTLYFANPGGEERFQSDYYFHWADFNNVEFDSWRAVVSNLLNIPMAHQLVGYYTVADDKDKTLKVLRSYQYYAVSKISDVVHQKDWAHCQYRGGFIWHTTGSGKTLTSFKSAQLISRSGDADKVVFVVDRIELAVQSLDEYRGFAGSDDSVQDTADTSILLRKLLSDFKDDRLIVTSIQKMSLLNKNHGIPDATLQKLNDKRLVFIVDECHRGVYGDMLKSIKQTFPKALLFGFTGTPVFEENARGEITTSTIFGDMLHKYTVADGITDGNVLRFHPCQVCTYSDDDLRERVALAELGVKSVDEIEGDEAKMKAYKRFTEELGMASSYMAGEQKFRGIEDYLPRDIYEQPIHREAVAKDIALGFDRLSQHRKFHAILATKNIPEAIEYYHIFKREYPSLCVVAVFDSAIANTDEGIAREDAIAEMLEDYNRRFHTEFKIASYLQYKKDVAKRLAHKGLYVGLEAYPDSKIDIMIVVSQMLTGYDSKWVNTLYLDKTLTFGNLIQAFSRTNRLFGPDKPFGTIKYYSFPHTMRQNIDDALGLYASSGLSVFVDNLEVNLLEFNSLYRHIEDVFRSAGVSNFECLPIGREERNMFAKDFCRMTRLLEAIKLQGFDWEQREYEFAHATGYTVVTVVLDEVTFKILAQRYRELFENRPSPGGGGPDPGDPSDPSDVQGFEYPIDTYITENLTGIIDAEYLNSRFTKYLKRLYMEGPGSELTRATLLELHKSFATLSQRDQRTAIIILHDIERGDLELKVGRTLHDYIAIYQARELSEHVKTLAEATGIDANCLQVLIDKAPNDQNIDEYGRFTALKDSADAEKTKIFLEKVLEREVKPRMVVPRFDSILRRFVLGGDVERKKIILAYLNEGILLGSEITFEEPSVEEAFAALLAEHTEGPSEEVDPQAIKGSIKSVIDVTLAPAAKYMRGTSEIVDALIACLITKSIDKLDGVGEHVLGAFHDIFLKKKSTKIDLSRSYMILVSKIEPYMKKLYYLISGDEVACGESATWADVLHSFRTLWNLRYSSDPFERQMSDAIALVKMWRNGENHASPTTEKDELQKALQLVITVYCYITGIYITDLEKAGVL